jgi:succinyl-CoA:acetate CoA-transferase
MAKSSERWNGQLPEQSAASVADRIPRDATVAVSGFGRVGYPKAVPLALAERDDDLSLTVLSGGSVGDEIDTALAEADAIGRRSPYQATAAMRQRSNDGSVAYHDRHVAGFGDEIRQGEFGDVDVAVVEAVAVGDDWLIPSTSIGHVLPCIEAADELVVEVNEVQPVSLRHLHDVYDVGALPDRDPIPLTAPDQRIGGPRVQFDPGKLVGVFATDHPDSPYSFREPTDVDRAIARNFTEFLGREVGDNPVFENRVTLQFGVGSLGNALMSELDAIETGGRDLAYYGEVIQDGLLDLIDAGQLETASATALALSEEGQRRLFDDVERYAESVVLRPAEVSNGPEPIRRLGIVAVNSALEVDVYGHVNSTHVGGTDVMNGIGGSADYNRNAAISVVTLPSTAKDGGINRIVPMVPHVDHTEHDVDVVVTERGVADLRGKCPRERAREIVAECAHPSYEPTLKEYLERAAETGGHIPHDLSRAFADRS